MDTLNNIDYQIPSDEIDRLAQEMFTWVQTQADNGKVPCRIAVRKKVRESRMGIGLRDSARVANTMEAYYDTELADIGYIVGSTQPLE